MEPDFVTRRGRPPAWIGRLLRMLIPPPAREAVMGDLEERYRSPGQYAAEGMRTVPYLIASRARRSSSLPIIGLQAFALIACLGVTLPDLPGQAAPAWAQGGIPALAALAALILRNVYRREEAPLRRGLIDALAAAAAMLLSQAALAGLAEAGLADPALMLPRRLYMIGFFALPVICILGAAEGRDESARAGPAAPGPAEAVARDYARFERRVRLRNRAEMAALGLIVAFSILFLLRFDPPMERFAWGCQALFLCLLLYLAARGAARPVPPAGGLAPLSALYRRELARQHRLRRAMWWFWFVPLFAGLVANLVLFGLARDQPLRAAAGAASFLLLALCIAALNRNRGREVRDKIASLEAMAAPA